ncbi:MAG TPA: peptidoglycan DD-metalloendopeptidase family protein [Patescibacteria group bacterium]
MSRPIKKIFVKFLVFLIRSINNLLKKLMPFFIGKIAKPFFWLFHLIYKNYHFIKKLLAKIYQPAKNRFFYPFFGKSVIHIIIIIIIFGVTFSNLQASAVSTIGQKSLLYSMVADENLQLIEETADLTREKKIAHLGPSVGVISVPLALAADEAEKENIQQLTTTTQGASALVKPNITSPLTGNQNRLRDETETYLVQENDTISSIAKDFGISADTILWENNLNARGFIKPGQKLTILPTSGLSHKVKSGDTIGSLAKKYSVEQKDILAFNEILDASEIKIGQTLIIPDGTPVTAPRPAPKTQLANIRDIFMPAPARPSAARLQWPTSGRVITQYYTWRHSGLDIDGHYDSPIYAAEGGTVEFTGWASGYGLSVVVNHGNGMKTRYAHASKIFVNPGQQVSRGQTLAMVGTTGWSTGTHLHFEVMINGVRQNPLSYVR